MTGEILEVQRGLENEQAVCLLKSGTIVGHIPREFSKVFWFFQGHGGRIVPATVAILKISMASLPIAEFMLALSRAK